MATERLCLPPLNAVRAFEAAARHLRFRRAAEELFVTTGAVGQQVRTLETHLGIPLFIRHGGTLVLTPAGRSYAKTARQSLLQLSHATRALTTERRTLTIWAPPTLATRWMIPRLAIFDTGTLEIRVCADTAEPDLSRMDVDIVIEHTDRPRCRKSVKLFDEELYPVCSPALVARLPRPLHPRALLSQPLLHSSLHDFWPAWLEAAGVNTDGERRGAFFNQASLALDVAAAGRGFALACDALVAHDLKAGRLVQAFPLRLRTGMAYRLATPKESVALAELEALRARLLAQA